MPQKLIKYIEIEEVKKLIAGTKDRKMKLAIALGFGSGLRISEVAGLRKPISRCCCVDIHKKKIKDKKIKYCSKCEKELSKKDIIRSNLDWLIEPLTTQQIILKNHTIKVFGKGSKERITCTSPWLNKTNIQLLPLIINRRTLQRRFTKLCERVLKKKMSFHTLRHGFGNYMVNEKNVPLPQVQSLLGHSRLDTTGIYTKANPVKAIQAAWESF